MTDFKTNKRTEFSSRHETDSYLLLENDIWPEMTSGDVVEISGGPGSGKTELLYHLIICSILPDINWKGMEFKGLNMKVVLIDNDFRFNLFRLITILERKLHSFMILNSVSLNVKEMSSFINGRLELLEIINCNNFDEFLGTLRQLEILRCQKCILMIDGITFYRGTEMRTSYLNTTYPNSVIASIIKNISENCGIPIIVTKRQSKWSTTCDRLKLISSWRKIISKQLELVSYCAKENVTIITVHNITDNCKRLCSIRNSVLHCHH